MKLGGLHAVEAVRLLAQVWDPRAAGDHVLGLK